MFLLNLYQFPLLKRYEKQVLWKIHKHLPIFCMVDNSTQNTVRMGGFIFYVLTRAKWCSVLPITVAKNELLRMSPDSNGFQLK